MLSSNEEALFAFALSKPAARRASWINCEHGDDKVLRARFEVLLAAHEQPEKLVAT